MFNWFRRTSKSAAGAPVEEARQDIKGAGTVVTVKRPAAAELPASTRKLSEASQNVLSGLPLHVVPARSCELYPQAVEKLLARWRDPIAFRRTLDDMLMDSRGGRQGFPFDIVAEFSALRQYYDESLYPVRVDNWTSAGGR